MPVKSTFGRYTAAQKAYLRLHYATGAQADIQAQFPGRSWALIQHQAGRLNCAHRAGGRPYTSKLWSAAATAFLLANYPTDGAASTVTFTGLPIAKVHSRAAYLGLARTKLRPPGSPKQARRAPRAPGVVRVPRPIGPGAASVLPVKLRPMLPNLNVAKETRKRREQPRTGLAEAIARHKTLRYGEREHTAFLEDGLAGWLRWKAQQAA